MKKASGYACNGLDKYQLFCSFLQYNQKFGNQDLIRSLYTRMSEADKQTETGQLITAYLNLPEEVNVGDEMVDGDLVSWGIDSFLYERQDMDIGRIYGKCAT